jgi:CheY-like chemotaxis protein
MSLRILVVEDHPDCADSMVRLLLLLGHETTVARDGPTAVQAAQDQRPDVVLLDFDLPGGMDAWEVARRINEQPGERPLLIAISGYGPDRAKQAESGIQLHIMKPIKLSELKDVLVMWEAVRH